MPAAVKLSICAIASEVVPLAKSGGLADVASALSRQLTIAGHDVRLFMPFYSQIRRDKLGATRVETLQGIRILTGNHEYLRRRLARDPAGFRLAGVPGRVRRAVRAPDSSTPATPTNIGASWS